MGQYPRPRDNTNAQQKGENNYIIYTQWKTTQLRKDADLQCIETSTELEDVLKKYCIQSKS